MSNAFICITTKMCHLKFLPTGNSDWLMRTDKIKTAPQKMTDLGYMPTFELNLTF